MNLVHMILLQCLCSKAMTLSSSKYHLLRELVNERLSQAQISAKIEPKYRGKDPLTMVIFCTIVSYMSN
jgi:cell division protein FtsL